MHSAPGTVTKPRGYGGNEFGLKGSLDFSKFVINAKIQISMVGYKNINKGTQVSLLR